MATTQGAFRATTKSPKQARALADAINAASVGSQTFDADVVTVTGSKVDVEASMTYAKAAVGPGHIGRQIEVAARRADGVEIRNLERTDA